MLYDQPIQAEPDEPEASSTLKYRLRIMLGLLILLVLVGVILARGTGKLQIDKVTSGSMEPTLQVGDVVVSDANAVPQRYDVLIFWDPIRDDHEEKLIKRLMGLPGDRIVIDGGILYINGEEEYSSDLQNRFWRDIKLTVPPDHYYFLGDNRGNSEDSLTYGPVPFEKVCGVAWFVAWPPSRTGSDLSIHESAAGQD